MAGRYDDFNRADSSSALGTPSDGGSAWSALQGTWGISSNRAYLATDAGDSQDVAVLATSTLTSGFVEATAAVVGSDFGLVARVSDSTHYILVAISPTTLILYQRNGATFTQLGSTYTGTISAGDIITLVCTSTTVTVKQNDISRISQSNSFNNTATQYGIRSFADTTARFDNLNIGQITADRRKVLVGNSNTVTITLTGIGTSWTGSPFSLTANPSGWSIASQSVASGTSATVTLNRSLNAGTLTLTDGVSFVSFAVVTVATSIAAGNWSAVATWDTGEGPGVDNTGVINHAVTVDTTATVGTSPSDQTTNVLTINTAGSLTLGAGVTLTVRGNVLVANTTFQVGTNAGGATLEFDASHASVTTTNYQCVLGSAGSQTSSAFVTRGTSGSHSIVRSNAGGGNASIIKTQTNSGLIDCQHTDFTRIGTASIDALQSGVTDAGYNPILLANCTFTSCGQVNSAGAIAAGSGFTISNTIWTSSLSGCLRISASGTTGTRTITFSSFDNTPTLPCSANATYTDNYFNQSFLSSDSGGTWASFARNLVRLVDVAGPPHQVSATTLYGGMADCYVIADSQNGNPHFLSPTTTNSTYHGLIFDLTETSPPGQDGGDGIFSGQNNNNGGVVEYCIVLSAPDGIMACCLINSNATDSWIVRHNTMYVGGEGGISVGDLSTSVNQITQYKDNIAWVPNGFGSGSVLGPDHIFMHSPPASGMISDTLTAGGSAHNYGWNLRFGLSFSPGGYDIKCSVAPNTTDIADTGGTGPNFVAPTRNLATWAVSQGSASGTYAGQVADGLSYLAANPNLIYSAGSNALIPWVRAGFAPQNVALHNTASDGTDIGAVAYQAPVTGGPWPWFMDQAHSGGFWDGGL